MKGYIAGLLTLAVSLLIAVFVYGMPAEKAVMSASQGAVYGLLPIGWIIVTSVFLYKITVKTGQFYTNKQIMPLPKAGNSTTV